MADTTLYVIAYDIPNNRRRTKIHKLLRGYGDWTQYSLFECWLSKRQLVELRARLNRLLVPEEDTVRLYGLCRSCIGAVVTIGSAKPHEALVMII